MILLLIASYALMIVGGFMVLVAAFRQSLLWGLGCIFLPIVSLIFLFAHWPEAKKGFFIQLTGIGVFVLSAIIAPATNPVMR